MRAPKSLVGQFFFFGAAEAFSFFLLVANTRAIAQGNYFWTALTDTIFSAQKYVVIKVMMDDKESRTWAAGLGVTIGGTCGSLLSIWMTKYLYGQ